MLQRVAVTLFTLSVLIADSAVVPAAPITLGSLYGTDAFIGDLLSINPNTGAATIVGPLGISAPALAVDPTTGIMYAGSGAGAANLYTVNPANAATSLVGSTGLGIATFGGMDFRADGTLFASVNTLGGSGTGSDHLATINPSNGLATIIGPFGTVSGGSSTIEGIEAIAFAPSGTLYAALSARGAAGAPGLYTINTTTGAATFLASILDATGSPLSGGIVSLQFLSDGTLFGGSARAMGGASDGGRLVTISPTTGVFSLVGSVPASSSSLGGLAGISPSAVIPEPSSLALLSIGCCLLFGYCLHRKRR